MQPKSATKPQRIEYLDGIEMLDIAAGQSTTFFIARPPPTQAAKDEAKTLIEAPTPPPPAAAATSSSAAAASPTPAAAAPALKPTFDISGFGFSFGAAASPGPSKPASPAPASDSADGKKRAAGISRTQQDAWEELQRWPMVLDTTDNCKVCGGYEADEVKGEILECEKVRLPHSAAARRRRSRD